MPNAAENPDRRRPLAKRPLGPGGPAARLHDTPMRLPTSERSRRFTESVIREMTRLCQQYDGVNLAQGFPDFPAPDVLKDAAVRAIQGDVNQYAITWGAKVLRDALVAKAERY